MLKHIFGLLFYYPQRMRSAWHFSQYQWHREHLRPTACSHKNSRVLSANIKTLTVRKQCPDCGEIITLNFNHSTDKAA